tara:strand:+ start:3295 stop:3993 length:699 start_codon:yes stop_codon:yes gene_type:complete
MNVFILDKIAKSIIKEEINIVGIHGPQGIGKTTLNKFLYNELSKDYNVIVLSLDDYYLPYIEMNKFLESCNDDLYKFRGLAGTHDLKLLFNTLINLKNNKKTLIPKYDKSLYNGFGDRIGYMENNKRIDIIILEGWMLGYKPIKNNLNCELNIFNDNLKKYDDIQKLINIWIILETDDLNNIFEWRLNAEPDGGMDLDTFKKFMEPYFVIYKNYSVDGNKIIVNKNREIVKC